MRWFVAAILAVLLAWGWFLASPYVAAIDLARAIEQRDSARLVARLNLQALRNAMARQIATSAAVPPSVAIGPADRQLAAAALTAAASPILDSMLTPEGIGDLIRLPLVQSSVIAAPMTSAELGRPTLGGGGVPALLGLFRASHWRGFRNVYFGLPPDEPLEQRVRLQFRLSRFKWRLVSLEVTPASRDRLAEAVLGR